MLTKFLRAAAGSKQPIAFFASSTSSTASITLPSNLTSKDLLILFDFSYNSNSTIPTLVSPSGWTNISNETDSYGGSNQTRAAVWYIAGSSSLSGTSVTGMAVNTGTRKICVVFRNAAFSSVGNSPAYDSSSGAATGTLSAGTSPYLGLAFATGSGTASLPTAPSGVTYTPSSSGSVICAYTLSGGTGTYTTNDSGNVTALKLLAINVTNI